LGNGHEMTYFAGQEVKGQGHTRPKLDLEGWSRRHSQPTWVESLS